MAGKSINWLILLVAVASMSIVIMADDQMQCFSCGYMLTHTGEMVKIPEKYEQIALCTEDPVQNDTTPTKPVGIVRKCLLILVIKRSYYTRIILKSYTIIRIC